MKWRGAIVVRTDLIEGELELRDAFYFAGSFDLRDVTIDGVAGIFRRLDHARFDPVATLAGLGRHRRDELERENRVTWNRERTVAGRRRGVLIVGRRGVLIVRVNGRGDGSGTVIRGGWSNAAAASQSRGQG